MDSTVEKNMNEINNGTYGSKINDKASGYKKGAMIGVIAGVLAGIYFKQKIMLSAAIALVGGGYIGYKIAEASETNSSFKNYGIKEDENLKK